MAEKLSEQGIIELIGEYMPARDPRLIVGPGDDAAVLKAQALDSVLTTDLLIEDVHFDLRYMSLADVGFKALAVNISDVAAMGSAARFALGNLGVPPGAGREDVISLLAGVQACAAEFAVSLIGGDTVRAAQWIIGFSVIGELNGAPFTRALAQPGDLILHSGSLGLAQVGLHALWGGLPGFELSRRAQLRPRPQTELAQRLRQSGIVPACIDLSDSLSKSLLLLAKASDVGIELDLRGYAFHPELRAFASTFPQMGTGGFVLPGSFDPSGIAQSFASLAEFLLSSAEDYGLLLAAPAALLEVLPELSVLGRVTESGAGCRCIDEQGHEHVILQSGFEHL